MHRYTAVALGVVVALGVSVVAQGTWAATPGEAGVTTAIPAMPLRQALKVFAQRQHLQFVYVSQVAEGVNTRGAPAGLSQRATLQALLQGTGLRFQYLNANTVTIAPASQPAIPDPPPHKPEATSAPVAQPQTLQAVVVTGTRVFDRTASESMSPIDVLTPQDLRGTGAPDLITALRTLLPSLNFPQPTGDDNSMVGLPAQLRGLSPEETLVLINGKRYHGTSIVNTSVDTSIGRGTSPVDLSTIPIAAIARVEVLRDGAAAQYGSAAIGGVINIILKGGSQHGEVDVTRSHYGREQGYAWQGNANGGFRLGNRGWVNLTVNSLNQHGTNRAGRDVRFPSDPTFDQTTFIQGIPPELQRQFAFNTQYDLGDHATLYGFGVYSHRTIQTYDFFRSLSQYVLSHPAAAVQYPAGYLPEQHQLGLDSSVVFGIKGDISGWHYDFSGSTGANHWKMRMYNSFNYSLGDASPTSFFIGSTAKRQNMFNADFVRNIDLGWYSPLTIAWGAQYRHDKYEIKNGDAASFAGSGTQGFSGFSPADAGVNSRKSIAEYVDFESQISQSFSAGLAARYEHYSDFGNDTSWKLSTRYAFNPALALRATASTGFRAPTLQEEFYSSTTTSVVQNPVTGQSELVTVSTLPVSNPVAKALGAQPLKPEKTHQYDVGVVVTPASGVTFTADAYKINISNRIILSGELTGPAVVGFLNSAGLVGVGGGQFFTNAVDTSTHGVDVIGTWPLTFGAAKVKLTFGGNYNKTEIRSVAPNPPQLGLGGLVLPILTRTQRGLITVNAPNSKVFVAGDWTQGHWSIRAQATRYSKWTFLSSVSSADQTYGSKTLLDASASYTLGRWVYTLGANNILNTYPDQLAFDLSSGGNLVYPESSPFGFQGAYWYANVAYRW